MKKMNFARLPALRAAAWAGALALGAVFPAQAQDARPSRMSGMSGMSGMAGMSGMQGGAAPADARDPHAWSGGYTLEKGPFALPGERQLRLEDEAYSYSVLVDRLEAQRSDGATTGVYDLQGWFGRDYDRLVLKAEGDVARGRVQESGTELLWGHAIASYWNTQLGVRHETGEGPSRNWLAFGVQGLAPYWFDVDVTGYLGSGGRTALGLAAEYELLLTQRLVLQPRIEATLYGKADPARGLGSGLSDLNAGLRLRYEFSRQFAPYIGVERGRRFGGTADAARANGDATSDTRAVAGVRMWF